MKNVITIGALVIGSALSASALAGGKFELSVPGFGSASAGTTSTVKNSTINVARNQSGTVTVGGGSIDAKVVSVDMPSTANVNTVNISGSEVSDTTISVDRNKSGSVTAIGGSANVNSVNIN